jgi:hypothetical protein
MAERITRPDVSLLGGNPDGNLSNLDEVPDLLNRKIKPDAVGLFYASRKHLDQDDDNDGAEVAKMKIRALECLTDGTFPFDIKAGERVLDVIDRLRSNRTGAAMLPVATDAEQAALDVLRGQLADWMTANDVGSRAMGKAWKDHFGNDVGGWRDASSQQIREFLLTKGEQVDAPVGERPTVPCPDWSAQVEHGPHEFDAANDGPAVCPGWPPQCTCDAPDGEHDPGCALAGDQGDGLRLPGDPPTPFEQDVADMVDDPGDVDPDPVNYPGAEVDGGELVAHTDGRVVPGPGFTG